MTPRRSSPSAWPTASVAAATPSITSAARSSSAPTRVGLLERIRVQTQRVFHPLAPDYTAMVPACVLSQGALDLGRAAARLLQLGADPTGTQQGLDPAYARRFIEAIDPAILDALPIHGSTRRMHNVVAYDLVSSAQRCPPAAARRRSTWRTSCGACGRTCCGRLARRGPRSRAQLRDPRGGRGHGVGRERLATQASLSTAIVARGARRDCRSPRAGAGAGDLPVAARRCPRGRQALRPAASSVKAVILAGGLGSRLSEETGRRARSRWSRSAASRSSGTS